MRTRFGCKICALLARTFRHLFATPREPPKPTGSLNPGSSRTSSPLLGGSLRVDDPVVGSDNPFLDTETAEHWRQVDENCQYECRHIFNPKLELDWKVCLWPCVMFFGLQVDCGNRFQALSDNMLDDLGLDINVYFLFTELPSQLVSKAVGPDGWIPTQMVLRSFVALSQCSPTGRGSFLLITSLLGFLEGDFILDLVLWLSYTSRKLPIRLSYFRTTLSVTGIITSLLAFALIRIIALCVGVASFFTMPASIVETKTWFRPKGWFTKREETIVVNRVLRDDTSKGDMHNRQALTPRRSWKALTTCDLWLLYAISFCAYVPQTPPKTHLILTLLGFSMFNTNILTIPADIVHIINLVLVTRLSERFNERSLVAIMQPLWALPCMFALRYWPAVVEDGTSGFRCSLYAIVVGWYSKNSDNVGNRTMTIQAGNVYAFYIYRDGNKPLYRRGNTTLLMVNLVAILKGRVWNALAEEPQIEYKKTTRFQGSRRLDFRFAH
ncbi:allantoate permease [Hypoxylon sp. FL1284]|nr:allantoate permease [Hypoxylon sp. FL1284]